MIQNLPPSVVLNSNKTKLQGAKNGAGILSKALSTHVSPSASSTSFIAANSQNIGAAHLKMNDGGQLARDSKGSGHGKYKQGAAGYARPVDFLSKQQNTQSAVAKLKI